MRIPEKLQQAIVRTRKIKNPTTRQEQTDLILYTLVALLREDVEEFFAKQTVKDQRRNPYMELMTAASNRDLPPSLTLFQLIQQEADTMAKELKKDRSLTVIQPEVMMVVA